MALGGKLPDQTQCTGSDRKIRIALSVINSPAELTLVLDGFLEMDIDCRQVLLIANCEHAVKSINTALRSWNNDDDDSVCPVIVNSESLSSGSVGPETRQLANYADWMDERLSRSLNKQLETGLCVLLVPLMDIDAELAVSQVLLMHSLNSVQLHDLVLNGSTAAGF